ncbi:hypothetical protein [Konateibacter massiliensis]|uniref:hypothetical protein n=1 Tax=Konateibacter massiliensis TaxID=2002841 RepID=UPI000C14F98E|nr:hypothetical protein [Konateibacter massiliensis]
MKEKAEDFVIKNYGKESNFSSFLPGISGLHGIPIWCYYVNRGQCVASFGVDNKDHAIMEFYPAHTAYQNVKRTGFRTFLRKNGSYFESFLSEDIPHEMRISKNGLSILEKNDAEGLLTEVTYFTLPGEKLGALVRKVTVTNTGSKTIHLEVLDGMPAVIPYGVDLASIKEMAQTTKAWMQVEDVQKNVPYYRVRMSLDDTAAVSRIEGGNFSMAYKPDGNLLHPLVDPELVFGYDNSLTTAVGFKEKGLQVLLSEHQITQNQIPCSFYGVESELAPQASVVLYEIIGQVEKKEFLKDFLEEKKDQAYFEQKESEAEGLIEELCRGITTKTALPAFDEYCKYTYMDNVLRGGYPMRLGKEKIFYVYSRKHGDLERDYNYFSMLPEFYSQGNGNFRDVNQNRRCDTFFAPFVGRENIKAFYSLIQLDGYNPLGVEKITYQLEPEKAEVVFASLKGAEQKELIDFATKAFTPGALYSKLSEVLKESFEENLFFRIIDAAESLVNGNFGEGYWSDHWTYNLDLIEEYLEIFPEKEKEMLYEEDYTYFLSQANINHRYKRYEITSKGLRQYHALNEESRRNTVDKLVRSDYGKGGIVRVSLIEKLLLLCTVKFAALDAYGMGVEMEGGKPGWYDALNGMPGMFGSSMAETYELCRMLEYTVKALKKYPGEVALTEELASLIQEIDAINRSEHEELAGAGEVLSFWNRINDAKEAYRDKVYEGIAGIRVSCMAETLAEQVEGFRETVLHGIEKACRFGGGICPTYFTYEVPEYEEKEDGIHPKKFNVRMVPEFLEGPVRYLKLKQEKEKKRELYRNVKNSDLYDSALSMYKVNASLANASFELGRARAFTPGWLENESIWLHMEYKYLLELLKSGLYREFFSDFKKAAVPFLDSKVYGRSIYENSSFIASSKNPNKNCHGKGFVARLSGSTIEFISIWKLLMFGRTPFEVRNGELVFAPQPAIPEYLITEKHTVTATLLGKTEVRYFMQDKKDYVPGEYQICGMNLVYKNGSTAETAHEMISGQMAADIRKGSIVRIEITLR